MSAREVASEAGGAQCATPPENTSDVPMHPAILGELAAQVQAAKDRPCRADRAGHRSSAGLVSDGLLDVGMREVVALVKQRIVALDGKCIGRAIPEV